MEPRVAWPSSLRRSEGADVAIFLTSDSKVIVQGMTGSEGRRHTQRMLNSGTAIVGVSRPAKVVSRSSSRVRQSRCSAA